MKNFIACMMVLVFYITATGQPPQAFNYQGIARNASGSPLVNTNISIRISVLKGSSPGTEVYKENHAVQTNASGIFALEIGHGNSPVGQFDGIDWGADNHYVQIEMDPAGGTNFTILGESQLLSVPYALHAGSVSGATNIWNENSKGIHYNQGNVGIGTSSPDQKLSIEGIDGTGINRYYINLDNRSLSNRSLVLMQLSAGQPNSFTSLQHISETYDFEGDKYSDFGILSSTGKGLIIRADEPNGIIKFLAGGTSSVTEERMRLSSVGNLGVGTPNPLAKIQVADGDIYIEDINNGVIMKSPNGNCWRLTINNDGTTKTTAITCPN